MMGGFKGRGLSRCCKEVPWKERCIMLFINMRNLVYLYRTKL